MLQRNGMGVGFPPGRLICRLYVIAEDGQEETMCEIEPTPPTGLYFRDLLLFLQNEAPIYMPLPGDYKGPDPIVLGGRGGGYTVRAE
jgi:hypothetical protein